MSIDGCDVFVGICTSVLVPPNKDLNRIKVVLVEHKRKNKWLAEQLGKDHSTVSKWCTQFSEQSGNDNF